jgi:hypothetical protein
MKVNALFINLQSFKLLKINYPSDHVLAGFERNTLGPVLIFLPLCCRQGKEIILGYRNTIFRAYGNSTKVWNI